MNHFHGSGPLFTLGQALGDIVEWIETSVRRACHLERAPDVVWVRQANNIYVGVVTDDGRRSRSRSSSGSARSGADGSAFVSPEPRFNSRKS